MDAPTYKAPPEDPEITAVKERSKQDDLAALQETTQIDTAAIMARYGTRLALAGAVPGVR